MGQATKTKLPNVGDKVWAFSPDHRREIKVQVKKLFANTFQGVDNEGNRINKLSRWRPANSTPETNANQTVEPTQEKESTSVVPRSTLAFLLLDQIKVERRFQQRSDLYNSFDDEGEPYLDPSIVERYQELLLKDDDGKPKEPPPLLVHRFQDEFYLVDGFHRYAALQAEGRLTAPCEIVESTEPDALLQSCTVNLKNGLGVRKADISRSIWRIFSVIDSLPDDDPRKKWSDRHIARMLGCSNSTVSLVHGQYLNKKGFEELKLVPGTRIKCVDPNSKYNGFVGQIVRLDFSHGCVVTFDAGQTTDVFINLPPKSVVKTQEVFVAPPPQSLTQSAETTNQEESPVTGHQSSGNSNQLSGSQPTGDHQQSSVSSQQTGDRQSSGNSNQSSFTTPLTSETVEPLIDEKQLHTATDDQINDLFAKSSGELLRRLNRTDLEKLDDLFEAVLDEIADFDQRQKEQFLVLLIDKCLF